MLTYDDVCWRILMRNQKTPAFAKIAFHNKILCPPWARHTSHRARISAKQVALDEIIRTYAVQTTHMLTYAVQTSRHTSHRTIISAKQDALDEIMWTYAVQTPRMLTYAVQTSRHTSHRTIISVKQDTLDEIMRTNVCSTDTTYADV